MKEKVEVELVDDTVDEQVQGGGACKGSRTKKTRGARCEVTHGRPRLRPRLHGISGRSGVFLVPAGNTASVNSVRPLDPQVLA